MKPRSKRNHPGILALLTVALLAPPWAFAAESCVTSSVTSKEHPPKGSEFQLFIENDMLSHTDRYYTNGIKFGIGVPGETLNELLCKTAKVTASPFLVEHKDFHYGWFIGQNLYTPKVITVAAPQPLDRPWAAWLYLGGVAQRAEDKRLDTLEIDVGMVGPAALGEQIQSEWHHLIGASKPLGWGNQIPNEPSFLVSYLQKRKIGSGNFEIVPHAGATVGTVFTLARAGGIARIGVNMSDFGPDSIEPGGAMLRNTRNAHSGEPRRDVEAYGFIGVDARLVARNVFLDGTLFSDSPHASRRTYVHDLTAGGSFHYGSFRLSFTRVLRSEEFYTAKGGGGRQVFDSVKLGFEF